MRAQGAIAAAEQAARRKQGAVADAERDDGVAGVVADDDLLAEPAAPSAGAAESEISRLLSIVVCVSVSHTSTGTAAMLEGCGRVHQPSRPSSAP